MRYEMHKIGTLFGVNEVKVERDDGHGHSTGTKVYNLPLLSEFPDPRGEMELVLALGPEDVRDCLKMLRPYTHVFTDDVGSNGYVFEVDPILILPDTAVNGKVRQGSAALYETENGIVYPASAAGNATVYFPIGGKILRATDIGIGSGLVFEGEEVDLLEAKTRLGALGTIKETLESRGFSLVSSDSRWMEYVAEHLRNSFQS